MFILVYFRISFIIHQTIQFLVLKKLLLVRLLFCFGVVIVWCVLYCKRMYPPRRSASELAGGLESIRNCEIF